MKQTFSPQQEIKNLSLDQEPYQHCQFSQKKDYQAKKHKSHRELG